jgi:hypothetical protein
MAGKQVAYRPGDRRLARVDQAAAKLKMTRQDTIDHLVDAGLEVFEGKRGASSQPRVAKAKAKGEKSLGGQGIVRGLDLQVGPSRPAPGSRLRGGR